MTSGRTYSNLTAFSYVGTDDSELFFFDDTATLPIALIGFGLTKPITSTASSLDFFFAFFGFGDGGGDGASARVTDTTDWFRLDMIAN